MQALAMQPSAPVLPNSAPQGCLDQIPISARSWSRRPRSGARSFAQEISNPPEPDALDSVPQTIFSRTHRPFLPSIIDSRRRNIRVPEPLLHLGNVGAVVEGVSRRGRAHHVRPHVLAPDPELVELLPHDIVVDAARRRRAAGRSANVVLDRPK